MYAVIEDSGTQIKVSEGDEILVDLRDLPDDAASLTFDKVLAVGGLDSAARIGQPYVTGVTVEADILKEESEKYMITKFRRRKNYRRRKGHTQRFLRVKVKSITG